MHVSALCLTQDEDSLPGSTLMVILVRNCSNAYSPEKGVNWHIITLYTFDRSIVGRMGEIPLDPWHLQHISEVSFSSHTTVKCLTVEVCCSHV